MTEAAARLPDEVELRLGRDLLLRRHRREDAAGICAQCQDRDMQRFTTVPVPYTAADAAQFLDQVGIGWNSGEVASFAIEVDGRFAGTIDLRLQEGDWAAIGFGLMPWARGRGVMTRAAGAVLQWGFDTLGLAGVEWRAVVGNDASWRVAQKCGFRLEGTVRGLLVHRGQRLDGWIGTLLADELRLPLEVKG